MVVRRVKPPSQATHSRPPTHPGAVLHYLSARNQPNPTNHLTHSLTVTTLTAHSSQLSALTLCW